MKQKVKGLNRTERNLKLLLYKHQNFTFFLFLSIDRDANRRRFS